MREILEIGLRLAGFGLVTLVLASFWIPGILEFRKKLADLSPLMRELFWTYAGYVLFSHIFMAVMTIFFRDWLLGGTGAAVVVSGYLCIWWGARVGLQFFGFDLSEVRDTPFNRVAKNLLTVLFVC